MRVVRALQATVLAAATVIAVIPGTAAQAYVARVDVNPTTIVAQKPTRLSLAATLPLGAMLAGEARNLRAELVMGSPSSDSAGEAVATGQQIRCQHADGSALPEPQQVWNTRNLWEADGTITLMARMLFIAPAAGSYRCQLFVYLLEGYGAGAESAAMLGGFIGDIDGPIHEPTQQLIRSGLPDPFFPLGGASQQLHHLTGYLPPAGATSFKAVGELAVTSCYDTGGNACRQHGSSFPGRDGNAAQVYSRIAATPSSSAPGCVAQASPPRTVAVSGRTHHLRIPHDLIVTLPASGCGTWTVNLVARDNGGTLPFVAHVMDYYSTVYARPI